MMDRQDINHEILVLLMEANIILPDQRFNQLLFNLGIKGDYNTESSETLKDVVNGMDFIKDLN